MVRSPFHITLTCVAASHLLCPAPAWSSSGDQLCKLPVAAQNVGTLLSSGNVIALIEAAQHSTFGSAEGELLRGMAEFYVSNDDKALTLLTHYLARPGAKPFSFHANSAISGIAMRQGRYAEAARALRTALANAHSSMNVSPAEVSDANRGLALADALSQVPPQKTAGKMSGVIDIARDRAGLPTGQISINGQFQRAILDTGANLSTVVRSKAASLGLRILPQTVTIASPVAAETSAQLAVADRVEVGGVVFRNVVFVVFPDDVLSFAGGTYKIEAVIGLPVLVQLAQLRFVTDTHNERLSFKRTPARQLVDPSKANLFLDHLTPKIVACSISGHSALQFALDSGARVTSLRPRFGSAFPWLIADTKPTSFQQGGAGGTVMRTARTVPTVDLLFGTTPITLHNLKVSEESLNEPGDDGRVGQDVLSSKGGYMLDFKNMRFELGGGNEE